MNIIIFRKVFNNTILSQLIFKFINYIFNNNLKVDSQLLEWNKLIESPFYLAGNGYTTLLKDYYNRKNSDDLKYNKKQTVILNALKSNSYDIIKYIIEELKYDYNSYGLYYHNTICHEHSGCDLLSISAKYCNLNIVKYIESLKGNNNNDDNEINWDYLKAFTLSPLTGHLEVVQFIFSKIQQDNSIFQQLEDYHLRDAIRNSLSKGRVDIVKWLINQLNHISIDLNDIEIIKETVLHGQLSALQYCIESGDGLFNYEELYDEDLIYFAASYGHIEVIKWLYAENIDTITMNAIEISASKDHWHIVEWLLNHYVSTAPTITSSPYYNDDSRFCISKNTNIYSQALKNGNFEMIDFLMRNGYTSTHEMRNVLVFKKSTMDSSTYLDIVKWYHKNSIFKSDSTILMDCVAQSGNLDALIWLHENTTLACSKQAMEKSIVTGCLDVVKWLHENRTECKTISAFSGSQNKGLEMVKWFHQNRTEGFIDDIMDLYASDVNGSFETLKWLHENLTGDIYSPSIMQIAIRFGNLEVIKWLHDNLTEGFSLTSISSNRLDVLQWLYENYPRAWDSNAMYYAFYTGNFEIINWLHENYTKGCRDDALGAVEDLKVLKWVHENRTEDFATSTLMDKMGAFGHIDIVKWLHENHTDGCSEKAIDYCSEKNQFTMLKWFHENRTEGCTTKAMDLAAKANNFEIVKWLHENRTEGCTTNAMDEAAWRSLKIVKWLHENRTEGCTANAMNNAAGFNQLKIVKFLHKNRTEGCTTDAMKRAAENKYWNVVKWLLDNRTESVTIDTIRAAVKERNVVMVKLLQKKYSGQYPKDLADQIASMV